MLTVIPAATSSALGAVLAPMLRSLEKWFSTTFCEKRAPRMEEPGKCLPSHVTMRGTPPVSVHASS